MRLPLIIFGVAVTLAAYVLSRVVAKRHPSPFTTPVFFSTPLVILALLATAIRLESIHAGELQGAVAGIAMGLAAVLTSVAGPFALSLVL